MLIGPTWWWKLDKEIKQNWKTNKRTRNERASERIEQKFNEILSKTREIEENTLFRHDNPLFRHDNRLFRQFLQNIGNCYQLHFMWKNEKYIEKVQWKCAKMAISGIFPAFPAEKYFSQKLDSASMWKKSVKTNDEISRKCQKPIFPAYFQHFSAGKVGQLKLGLCHILGIAILQQCAKFNEKI